MFSGTKRCIFPFLHPQREQIPLPMSPRSRRDACRQTPVLVWALTTGELRHGLVAASFLLLSQESPTVGVVVGELEA